MLASAPLSITKRDGTTQPFDPLKVQAALFKCLKDGMGAAAALSGSTAAGLTERVLNVLAHRGPELSVEQVQDTVIEQLWAAGLPEAATAYTVYREEQRRRREATASDPEDLERIKQDATHFPTALQYYQFLSKYARWNEHKGRRETWEECVTRVLDFFREEVGERIPEADWSELHSAILKMEALPSMRALQMAGPAARRCNVVLYNCAALPIDKLHRFSELLYILMSGTGCGFTVESDYVYRLPQVRKQKKPAVLRPHLIPDTTEGWCDALRFGLESWFAGEDVEFDYSQIRAQGERLYTKGGRASGADPLRQLLNFTRERVFARQGKHLTTLDCHDICCMIGWIVQVGGVRRAAEISLSDLDDAELRDCKKGQFWNTAPWRAMSNNSAVYEEKPSVVQFLDEWLALIKSQSGERGIFNREGMLKHLPKRRKRRKLAMNPCGEVNLLLQFCNLSGSVARYEDTSVTLRRKVRLAAILGTIQSYFTRFNYLSDEWRQICEDERLLGVDINGQMDCPLLRPGAPGREAVLEELRELVIATNREYAGYLGINPSVATTVVKPSGNSSVLLNCSSGLHARHAPYYIRRVRGGSYDPLTQLLKDAGHPCYPEVGHDPTNPSVIVFEFPVASPPGGPCRDDLTALEQLENWLVLKQRWTEHNPSVTISVGDDEWLAVGQWLYAHWDWVGGLSFLPRSDHVYQLAPYEEITAAEYAQRMAALPPIPWEKLSRYELEDKTTSAREYACTGGTCEL